MYHPDQVKMNNLPQEHENDQYLHQLRESADRRLEKESEPSHFLKGRAPDEIIHELQVHQVELEIQNEELKKAHLELERSRDQYQALFDFAPVGYVTLSPDALIRQINLTGASMLAVPRSKLINARFRKFVAPEQQDEWDRFFIRVFNHDEKQTISIMLVPAHDEVIATRIEGFRQLSDGEHYVAHLVISDISDTRRVEMELHESEERFRMLFQHIPSISVQGYGPDGITRYWNDASEELYGYSAHEAIGRSLLDLIIPPEMRDAVKRDITHMVETGEPVPAGELILMRKDGERIPVFSSHTIIQRTGLDTELFCVDISLIELRKTEQALLEANKKTRILSSLTRHDIVNHISALYLTLDTLKQESDLEGIRSRISSALEICERIETTNGFTREFESLGEAGCGWIRVHPIITYAQGEISLHGVTVENLIPPDLEIYADPILRKVFSTLMENSLRHAGALSRISCTGDEIDGNYLITYEDDGIGIAQARKELIFNHGYGEHTGIGLFLAREVLSITGLAIRECGEEGQGARFEISIPSGKFRRSGN